jgi:hypothetical protein
METFRSFSKKKEMERTNRKGSNILRKRNGNGETINGNENEGALPTETKTVEEIPKKKNTECFRKYNPKRPVLFVGLHLHIKPVLATRY